MAYNLSNKGAENCCKRTVLVQLIVGDVVTFFGRSVDTTRRLQSVQKVAVDVSGIV